MKKSELLGEISTRIDLPKVQVEYTWNAIFETIKKYVAKGEEVPVFGFGKFSTIKTKARNGVNPQTGKPIKIAAGKRIKFSASKTFKDQVAGKAPAKKTKAPAPKKKR